jgi:poly-D-alanine transfer protein DltD
VKIKNPKLVEVEWVDIFATSGWEKLDEVNPPVCIRMVI